ncbi:cytochrome c family protein [Erythrobacter sp. YJ-T3-07]|uniref:c-type cytochrome n=1 Tax=Erythrobacter sp. YJ-T3-07 TaxID=2793063 RepID=UPI001F2ECFCA|nr:cytochrome c family protein [Erythrobacter sp. YJ-T3-07]
MQKSHVFVGSMALACLLVSAGCNSRADEEPAAPATTEAPATTAAADTAAPAADVEFASLTGDPAAGEKAFAVCTTCHSVEAGVNKTGPSLHGVVGREAGSIADFNYSDANKSSGITWTPEELFVYLADPQATIPGTKMIFPGLKDPQKRADVIAYLETQS